MNTYLVTLADRSTGKDQRILVQSVDSNNMQEFVESDAVRPTLSLNDPVVIAVHRLRVNRPHRTVFPALEKTNG
jgi:hypothetical protein